MITLQAFFRLYLEGFLKNEPHLRQSLEQLSRKLSDACRQGVNERIERAHQRFIDVINSSEVIMKMPEYDIQNNSSPLFVVTRNYMRMVMEMFSSIKAVRTGNWKWHLSSLEVFTKYFFAHDKINYGRMIPVYLAEMASLKDTDPRLYEEFTNGNWVVNKNLEVPFRAVRGDNALEHLNRSMKVSGGLVGITLNAGAWAMFFIIDPEQARLATEAKSMAGLTTDSKDHHHDFSPAITTNKNKAIHQLAQTIKSYTDPFSLGDNAGSNTDLYNVVTKKAVCEKTKKDLIQQSEIGQKLFSSFVEDRVKSGGL